MPLSQSPWRPRDCSARGRCRAAAEPLSRRAGFPDEVWNARQICCLTSFRIPGTQSPRVMAASAWARNGYVAGIAVLQVPSVIVPENWCAGEPKHADVGRIQTSVIRRFEYDSCSALRSSRSSSNFLPTAQILNQIHAGPCPPSQKLALREEVAVPPRRVRDHHSAWGSASRAHLSGPGRAGTGRNMAARTSVLLG